MTRTLVVATSTQRPVTKAARALVGFVRQQVDALVAKGHRKILVDLGGVTYIDSAGVGMMAAEYRIVKAKGGTLVTCNCSDVGQEVLNAARFNTLWSIYPTREQALEFKGRHKPFQLALVGIGHKTATAFVSHFIFAAQIDACAIRKAETADLAEKAVLRVWQQ